jgi:hypothetical protein
MEHIYVLVPAGAEWEDIIIFVSMEEAIEKSKSWSKTPVQIFAKHEKGGYRPTYSYYLNGVYVEYKG